VVVPSPYFSFPSTFRIYGFYSPTLACGRVLSSFCYFSIAAGGCFGSEQDR